MEKIPFDLEKYHTGEYDVVTRDDRPARIICTDAKGSQPIVALIQSILGSKEYVYRYSVIGKVAPDWGDVSDDLFLIPKDKQEPKKEEGKSIDDKLMTVKSILKNELFVICEKKVKELDETITAVAEIICKLTDNN